MTQRVSTNLGVLLLLATCAVTDGRARASVITVDTPNAPGVVDVQAVRVSITVIDVATGKGTEATLGPATGELNIVKGMAIKDKATTIATALGKLANVKTATVVGNTIQVVGQKDSTAGLKDPQRFVGVEVLKDTTQEPKAKVTDSVKGVDPPEVAVVGYSGRLSGVDGTGAEAVYQATLGDSDFTALSNLTYSTVLEDSIKSGMSLLDTLVVDTYDMLKIDLTTSLKADLFLDLPDDQVFFLFPGTPTDPFAGSYTSDATAASLYGAMSTSVTAVPELPTWALIAGGFLSLAMLIRGRPRPMLA
jgi:hypothetical protein